MWSYAGPTEKRQSAEIHFRAYRPTSSRCKRLMRAVRTLALIGLPGLALWLGVVAAGRPYIRHVAQRDMGAGPDVFYLHAPPCAPWGACSVTCTRSVSDLEPARILGRAALIGAGLWEGEVPIHFGAYRQGPGNSGHGAMGQEPDRQGDVYYWSFRRWELVKFDTPESSGGNVDLRELAHLGCDSPRFR